MCTSVPTPFDLIVLAGFLLGTRQTILETKDGGNTWVQRSIPSAEDEEFNYRFNSISFRGKEGWIVGKPAILLYTSDGGDTWRRIPLSSQLPGDIVILPANIYRFTLLLLVYGNLTLIPGLIFIASIVVLRASLVISGEIAPLWLKVTSSNFESSLFAITRERLCTSTLTPPSQSAGKFICI